MAGEEERRGDSDVLPPTLRLHTDAALGEIARALRELARAQRVLQAVMALDWEAEQPPAWGQDLPTVLRRIVGAAADLVRARYGALGVLDESGERLAEFITVGLSEQEQAAACGGAGFPTGRGLLGHLIRNPEPLRVDNIAAHPASVGFPPGHPPMRTLLGAAISIRGKSYGDLYLSERRDGQPFDAYDEAVVVQLAVAAAVVIDRRRLFQQVRTDVERFQRLLLPTLPDLTPFEAAAVYRPAAGDTWQLGGDWYDAIALPGDAIGAVIGDVAGHDLHAAAAMAQTRNMLRALLYDRCTPPSAVLGALDRTLSAITQNPVTTACVARIEPRDDGWRLHWSIAGHLPPLLLTPGGAAEYLHTDPGIPLGVDPGQPRSDSFYFLPTGATVIFFTDGLVECPGQPIDTGLDALAAIATANARLPLDELCQALADQHPSPGRDDIAILALRVPAGTYEDQACPDPPTPSRTASGPATDWSQMRWTRWRG